jgi:hypothetical protein
MYAWLEKVEEAGIAPVPWSSAENYALADRLRDDDIRLTIGGPCQGSDGSISSCGVDRYPFKHLTLII